MKNNHKILLSFVLLPLVTPIVSSASVVKQNIKSNGIVLGASTYNSEQEAISSVVAKLGACSKATGDQKITCLTEVLFDLTKIFLNRNSATNSTDLNNENSKVLDSYTFSIDETHKYFITTLYYGKNGYSKNATIEFKKDGDSKYVTLENTQHRADSYVTVLIPIINTETVSGTFRIKQEGGKYSNELRAVLSIKTVLDKNQNHAINDIMSPVAGSVWTVGDTQTIKWSTVNIPDNIIGKIYIMKSTEVMYEDIARNTGSYVWNNNKPNGEYFVNPGVYTVKIVMNGVEKISSNFTIKQRAGTPVVIDAYNTLESVDGQIKKYNLKITAGLNDNPATKWSLNFTCPSNVSQVLARVAGDVCDGADYVLGGGDTEISELNIPLIVTHTDFNTSYLKILIKAITRDGVVGGYTTYLLPILSSMG